METYLTIVQFEDLIQSTTVKTLGWDLIIPSKAEDVRINWPTEGAPAAQITQDIIYLRCIEVESPINKQREIFHQDSSPDLIERIGYSRTMEVSFICYGPYSYDNAEFLRAAFFYQEIHDLLAAQSVYIIPDIAEPRRVPELFESRWWERTDIQMRFNVLVVRERTVPYIELIDIYPSVDTGIEQIDMPVIEIVG